ncbi:uncharacterized protein LOC129592597 [Paramacrobiotus metropolitanus]|uniref:uncharacterized protein LOC129592597 n=1 Tax=Paramacrobiotus metropolitanus TaxID=2943436 RepID=UPI002445DF76|nr:uncharacterized protein LOC129592597 [Paramacrobiotus metropolitanus]
MHLGRIFVVLAMAAVVSISARSLSSTNSCANTDSNSLLMCMAPTLMYILGPDYQQIMNTKDASQITEAQLVGICKMGRTVMGCVKDMAECYLEPSQMADTYEMLTGSIKLMDVCDRPDFYSKYHLMAQCTKIINQTSSKTRGCFNAAMRTVMNDYPTNAGPGRVENALALVKRRDLIRNMCCMMNSYETCTGSEIADKCGAEVQDIATRVNNAIRETFKCYGPRGENCPVQPAPTAEDEAGGFDIQKLFGAGMGGFGGMGGLGGGGGLSGLGGAGGFGGLSGLGGTSLFQG